MEHKSPEHVALVAIGGSRTAFIDHAMSSCYKETGLHWDEVWTVNSGFWAFNHDKVFIMDDLRVQATRYPVYGERLKVHPKPIITSTPYDEFPTAVAYPIQEVVDLIGENAWLNNTVIYAIAYALLSGVKQLYLYGADFYYINMTRREEGAQAAAYLIGIAKGLGMQTILPQTTSLLAAGQIKVVEDHVYRPLYGYMQHPLIEDEALAKHIQKDQECRQGNESRHVDHVKPLKEYARPPRADGPMEEERLSK